MASIGKVRLQARAKVKLLDEFFCVLDRTNRHRHASSLRGRLGLARVGRMPARYCETTAAGRTFLSPAIHFHLLRNLSIAGPLAQRFGARSLLEAGRRSSTGLPHGSIVTR